MKYRKAMRERVDRLIQDCRIMRYTAEETKNMVRDVTGIEISVSQIEHRRGAINRMYNKIYDSYKWKDRSAYIAKFMERIDDAELCIATMRKDLAKYKDDEKRFFYRQKCIYGLIEAGKYAVSLYQALPQIDALGYTADNDPVDAQVQRISGEAETAGILSQRKF